MNDAEAARRRQRMQERLDRMAVLSATEEPYISVVGGVRVCRRCRREGVPLGHSHGREELKAEAKPTRPAKRPPGSLPPAP